jgi:RND family efflux transporter MFP subunit
MHVRAPRLVYSSLACVYALLLAACTTSKVNATAEAPTSIPKAAVAVVEKGRISNSLSVAGEFTPYQEVELHAKVAGYVRKMYVDIGDHVRAGQVLAVLEVPELNAQVQGAQAGVRHSTEEITRAKSEVSRAQASHDALHAAAMRLEQASKARPGLIAEQELEDAQARDRESEAQVAAAKSALGASEQQLEISRASQSQVSAMQDYSRIVAPFDGVVTWRYADTGALIQAGTSNASSAPVVKLAEVDTLRLRVPVPESIAARVHVGMPASIQVQATEETLTGTVKRYTDSLDRSTRTMQVEIDVPNKAHKLAPGMYANVTLEMQNIPDAITIPIQALMQSGNNSSVMIVTAENRVERREVKLGAQDSNKVQVLSGLKEGDRVIAANLSSFQSGQTVEPRQASIAAGRPE